MRHFLYEKWGDLVAICILLLGVGLVCWGCPSGRAPALGESLVMAALVGLKLTKTNGGATTPPAPKKE